MERHGRPAMWSVAIAIAVSSSGCGDGGRICGTGTVEDDGVCGVPPCTDGTRFDPSTGRCELDDAVCGDGTVLLNGRCRDPSAGLIVDAEEGPEPNGFELGATPAGTIALRPPGGEGFTLHGCIEPSDPVTPDLDSYLLAVPGPTLLEISADGVRGLAAGFIVIGDPANPLLLGFQRFGIDLATDTSIRQLYLPTAGTYQVIFADVRSLLPLVDNGTEFPPAGNPDGTSCYYVTIDQRTPAPIALDLESGDSGTLTGETRFYTAAFPEGLIQISAAIDSRAASGSLVLVNNDQLRQINNNGRVRFGGIRPGDEALVVLDPVFAYAISPPAFQVTVDAALDSQALSTSGGAVAASSRGRFFRDPSGKVEFDNLNVFHWDVAGDDNFDGVDIAFSRPVSAQIFDQDFAVVSNLTGLDVPVTNQPPVPETPAPITFTAYKGLLRETTAGRYYFAAFLPRDPVATPFTVTSTITPLAAPVITRDVAIADQAPNAFESNPFRYDAGTSEPWHLLNATGAGTGDLRVRLYDAAIRGRLDGLVITRGAGAGVERPIDDPGFTEGVQPVFELGFPADGSAPRGVMFRNGFSAGRPPTELFVAVGAATRTGARTFGLEFRSRAYHDFATLAAGSEREVTDQPLVEGGDPERRFFADIARFDRVSLTVTPTTPGLDPAIALLDPDEAERQEIDAGGADQAETITLTQRAQGFTAFKVRAKTGEPITGSAGFALAVKVEPPFYTIGPGTTAFADACAGGTVHVARQCNTITPGACGGLPTNNDGLTAPVAAPAGFTFFGEPVTSFVISTNGFLSFNPASTEPESSPHEFPDDDASFTPGDVGVAPFWSDLGSVDICTRTVGDKLVVQWVGAEFGFFGPGDPVAFQAILDPATGSIEYVYGPGHVATGDNAVAGLQNPFGDQGNQVGAFSRFVTPGSSRLLSPP